LSARAAAHLLIFVGDDEVRLAHVDCCGGRRAGGGLRHRIRAKRGDSGSGQQLDRDRAEAASRLHPERHGDAPGADASSSAGAHRAGPGGTGAEGSAAAFVHHCAASASSAGEERAGTGAGSWRNDRRAAAAFADGCAAADDRSAETDWQEAADPVR